jgi:hypothetical protein
MPRLMRQRQSRGDPVTSRVAVKVSEQGCGEVPSVAARGHHAVHHVHGVAAQMRACKSKATPAPQHDGLRLNPHTHVDESTR